ncbi:tetratricopeptide repeat protein, partial [uncultured Mucilaginibacter sp.]|uniref:tetratricopeptide repeat protein n=1 Tax=uncultured Mucilaginibacter sp. TaxID=797541 RepID=UPI0025E39FCC
MSERNRTDYKRLYYRAEKLSNSATPSANTDKEALSNYVKVVRFLSAKHIDDHFLFRAYISTATFLQVLNRQRESVIYLKNAISLKENLPDIRDSAFFKPLVYCGNAYYQLDQPDSAAIYYSKAEHIADNYPKVSELERLYNTLGVIAYSSGNYNQSVTYYQKAISTLTDHPVYVKTFLVVYQNNLASALKKLKRYDEALKIYQGLLPYGIETDALLHNIGSAYLAKGKYAESIQYLNKVKYNDQKKFNDLGRAYFGEKDYAPAAVYLQKAADLNTKTNQGRKFTDYGITLKYFGDLWFEKGQTLTALSYYQKSINNLVFGYRGRDIYDNPATFTSVFNTMELLETLNAKAIAFKKMYTERGKVKDLEASLQTYLAFYKLANYVERVYDNDESRLLITDKKYASHQQPINICLQLFGLTNNRAYLEQAFRLDEENKANVLSLYLREAKIKAGSGIPLQWLQQETALKRTITKITLVAADEKDSLKLA